MNCKCPICEEYGIEDCREWDPAAKAESCDRCGSSEDMRGNYCAECAFQTPGALNRLDEIHRYAKALDTAMGRLDELIPPPAGCVSGLTADNRHGWFIKENIKELRSVSRVRE